MDFSKIYEGWKNNLLPSEELKDIIEQVSSERLAICNACPNHSKNHKSVRPDAHCVACGCTLAAKTKCLSCECPLKKWVAKIDQKQEEEINNGK